MVLSDAFLTVTDRTALVLRLDGFRTGQDWTDDWVTDHCSLLQRAQVKDQTSFSDRVD